MLSDERPGANDPPLDFVNATVLIDIIKINKVIQVLVHGEEQF